MKVAPRQKSAVLAARNSVPGKCIAFANIGAIREAQPSDESEAVQIDDGGRWQSADALPARFRSRRSPLAQVGSSRNLVAKQGAHVKTIICPECGAELRIPSGWSGQPDREEIALCEACHHRLANEGREVAAARRLYDRENGRARMAIAAGRRYNRYRVEPMHAAAVPWRWQILDSRRKIVVAIAVNEELAHRIAHLLNRRQRE
jgi:hypothetical protein